MTDEKLIAKPGSKIKLKDYDPKYTGEYKKKKEAVKKLEKDILKLEQYQDMLYAQDTYGLLIVLQALDAWEKMGRSSTLCQG